MYRQAARPNRRCPRCARPLESRQRAGFHYDLCNACGGTFIDGATLAAMWHELARANDEAPLPQPRARPAIYRLPCPACGGRMARVDVMGVPVDRCDADGLWFDPPELEIVLMAATLPFHEWLRTFAVRLRGMR
jgi:Zn-finger nucleic acid-binding protein